jgi:hypothetical protein
MLSMSMLATAADDRVLSAHGLRVAPDKASVKAADPPNVRLATANDTGRAWWVKPKATNRINS